LEPAPWHALARAVVSSDSAAAAIAAAERSMLLAPREETWATGFGLLLLETGRLTAADSLIRDWSRPGSERLSVALDLKTLLLREQGEYGRAATLGAQTVARAIDNADATGLRLVLGNSLARSNDVLSAVREFEHAARHPRPRGEASLLQLSPSAEARSFAWPHALLADALYLSGSRDTIRLLVLADSIEAIGSHSAFGRDARLHFHVRGLVAEIGSRWQEAERLFERARWGRGGWTRTNVELARTQVTQGRPLDAVRSLRDTRFGTLDGMGRYEPRTEINAAIAEAFLSARSPDSARAYVAQVRAAWATADPAQRRRLAALERSLQKP
jgi:hypothetical protein